MTVLTVTESFITRAVKRHRENPEVKGFWFEDPFLLYIDGASRGNPGEAGVGIVIKGHNGQTVKEIFKYIGVTTNNRAEYTALIEGLKAVKQFIVHRSPITNHDQRSTVHRSRLMVFTDSELLVRQLKGEYRVRESNLKALYQKVSALIKEFESQGGLGIEIRHISREDNKEADRLANKAIDSTIRRQSLAPFGSGQKVRSRPDDRSPTRGEESPSSVGQGAP